MTARTNTVGTPPGEDDGTDETNETNVSAPLQNPENGPMLSENLGPPPETHFDLTEAPSADPRPMGLTPGQVTRAMNPLLSRCQGCAAYVMSLGAEPHGRVTARIRVRNDGHPIAARVTGGGGDPRFITCVRRVVASARFTAFAGPEVFTTWGFDVD